MAKNFVGDGAGTRDLVFHDGERQFQQRFSGFLGALAKWLLGIIILSPDLRSGRHYVARFDPVSTQTTPAPLLGLQHAAYVPGEIFILCVLVLRQSTLTERLIE